MVTPVTTKINIVVGEVSGQSKGCPQDTEGILPSFRTLARVATTTSPAAWIKDTQIRTHTSLDWYAAQVRECKLMEHLSAVGGGPVKTKDGDKFKPAAYVLLSACPLALPFLDVPFFAELVSFKRDVDTVYCIYACVWYFLVTRNSFPLFSASVLRSRNSIFRGILNECSIISTHTI